VHAGLHQGRRGLLADRLDIPFILVSGQVGEETRTQRSGRKLVMARFVELMLIEALRSCAEAGDSTDAVPPGLLRGLSDARLAQASQARASRVELAAGRPRGLCDGLDLSESVR